MAFSHNPQRAQVLFEILSYRVLHFNKVGLTAESRGQDIPAFRL